MEIKVNSPHSGRPVIVREADVGRALRDENAKVFYVLRQSDDKGYYGSRTRAGGSQEERNYIEISTRSSEADLSESAPPMHDLTGNRRPRSRGKLVILVLVVIALVIALLWALTVGPWVGYRMAGGCGAEPDSRAGTTSRHTAAGVFGELLLLNSTMRGVTMLHGGTREHGASPLACVHRTRVSNSRGGLPTDLEIRPTTAVLPGAE